MGKKQVEKERLLTKKMSHSASPKKRRRVIQCGGCGCDEVGRDFWHAKKTDDMGHTEPDVDAGCKECNLFCKRRYISFADLRAIVGKTKRSANDNTVLSDRDEHHAGFDDLSARAFQPARIGKETVAGNFFFEMPKEFADRYGFKKQEDCFPEDAKVNQIRREVLPDGGSDVPGILLEGGGSTGEQLLQGFFGGIATATASSSASSSGVYCNRYSDERLVRRETVLHEDQHLYASQAEHVLASMVSESQASHGCSLWQRYKPKSMTEMKLSYTKEELEEMLAAHRAKLATAETAKSTTLTTMRGNNKDNGTKRAASTPANASTTMPSPSVGGMPAICNGTMTENSGSGASHSAVAGAIVPFEAPVAAGDQPEETEVSAKVRPPSWWFQVMTEAGAWECIAYIGQLRYTRSCAARIGSQQGQSITAVYDITAPSKHRVI